MSPFIISALNQDGSVLMVDTVDIDAVTGAQAYSDGSVVATLEAVESTDPYVGGARYREDGALRLYDATSALPAGVMYIGGMAFSATGQLCVTTDAVSDAMYISGVAVRQDGAVYVDFGYTQPVITVGPTWTDNGDGTATVTFTTDIDCYGGIDYGTSTGVYTSSAFDYSTYPTLEFSTSHTVPVPDAGAGGTLADGTYYYRVWAGTPEGFNGYISDEETGTIASIQEIDMLFWGIGSNAVNAGATDYSLPGSQTTNATEAIRQLPINRAMTLKNFAVGIRTAQPGTGSLVCTVRKNGSATALTVTFAAGAAASVVIDSVNEVAFAAGDLLSVQFVNNASAGSGAITGWTIETVDA